MTSNHNKHVVPIDVKNIVARFNNLDGRSSIGEALSQSRISALLSGLSAPICGDADFYAVFRHRVPFLHLALTDFARASVAETGATAGAAHAMFAAGFILGSHVAPLATEAEPCPELGSMNDWLDAAEKQSVFEVAGLASALGMWAVAVTPLVEGPVSEIALRALVWSAPGEPFILGAMGIDAPMPTPRLSPGEQIACFAAGLTVAGWGLPKPCSCRVTPVPAVEAAPPKVVAVAPVVASAAPPDSPLSVPIRVHPQDVSEGWLAKLTRFVATIWLRFRRCNL